MRKIIIFGKSSVNRPCKPRLGLLHLDMKFLPQFHAKHLSHAGAKDEDVISATWGNILSMGWLQGRSTGNHRVSDEIWDFLVGFPLKPINWFWDPTKSSSRWRLRNTSRPGNTWWNHSVLPISWSMQWKWDEPHRLFFKAAWYDPWDMDVTDFPEVSEGISKTWVNKWIDAFYTALLLQSSCVNNSCDLCCLILGSWNASTSKSSFVDWDFLGYPPLIRFYKLVDHSKLSLS